MAVAARVYLYGIALVALGMFITGAAGLLALVLEVIVQSIGGLPATIGDSQVRSRASLSGALTVIGLLAWTSHWWLADQATHRRVYERAGAEAFEDYWAKRPQNRNRWP